MTFDGETKVTKSGRTTGTTIGDLKDDSLTFRVETFFMSRGFIAFYNCYAVENILGMNDFFKQGDSGSGVFVIENGQTLKPLGIAFAFLSSQTAVCKINRIINKLDLTIMRYGDSKQKQADNISSERNQEPMCFTFTFNGMCLKHVCKTHLSKEAAWSTDYPSVLYYFL